MKSNISKLALVVVLCFATTFAIAQATSPDQSSSGQSSSQTPQYPSTGGTSSNDVQKMIQSTFQKDPTLASSSISVSVTDTKVELSGTAKTQAEKDKAKSIAESYAGSRQIVDNVKVSGGGSSTSPSTTQPPQ
jgi:hyperosmotically inducible periplasmic protein